MCIDRPIELKSFTLIDKFRSLVSRLTLFSSRIRWSAQYAQDQFTPTLPAKNIRPADFIVIFHDRYNIRKSMAISIHLGFYRIS